jgi:hypothetical protein
LRDTEEANIASAEGREELMPSDYDFGLVASVAGTGLTL